MHVLMKWPPSSSDLSRGAELLLEEAVNNKNKTKKNHCEFAGRSRMEVVGGEVEGREICTHFNPRLYSQMKADRLQ